MPTYVIPAEGGKLSVDVKFKKDNPAKSWLITGTNVVVEVEENLFKKTDEADEKAAEELGIVRT